MKRLLFMVALVVLLLSIDAAIAQAQESFTGQDLLIASQAAQRVASGQSSSRQDMLNAAGYYGFVLGIVQGLLTTQAFPTLLALPWHGHMVDYYKVVAAYLPKHPGDLDLPAAIPVIWALEAAYPPPKHSAPGKGKK